MPVVRQEQPECGAVHANYGREFGLEVNPNIDERYHVEKATRAACKYLKDAYQRYGNWLCVAAAYNGGQGRISSELKKQLVNQAVDLWLVEETSVTCSACLPLKPSSVIRSAMAFY